DVHRPVAGAADIALAALLEGLVGADLVAQIVALTVLGDELVAELVVESFRGEITLLLGDPLLQPHMRRDDELCHGFLSRFWSGRKPTAASLLLRLPLIDDAARAIDRRIHVAL